MNHTLIPIVKKMWGKYPHTIKGLIGFTVMIGFVNLLAHYSPEQTKTRKAISRAIQTEDELYGRSKYAPINEPFNRTAKDGVYASKNSRVHKGRYGFFVWCRDIACGTIRAKANIFDLENKSIGRLADSKMGEKGQILLMLPFESMLPSVKVNAAYIQLVELKIDGRDAF